jgi:anaerobic magnesium-protoporphyrin IX monomethyl ester cyclase
VHLDLIAGLPYEDYTSFAKSFNDAYGSSDMLQLGFLKLLHGTELRARAEEYEYRYLSTPPYTVLQSKWITYEQMQRLTHIAEVLDRYLESGRFAHVLWYLTPLMPSPFGFWEGLSIYLENRDTRPLQRISQPDAFRYLLEYAKEKMENVDLSQLKKMLAADFAQHENKNPPAFLH